MFKYKNKKFYEIGNASVQKTRKINTRKKAVNLLRAEHKRIKKKYKY